MVDAQGIVMGLADLAVKVKDKADQAEASQVTCKVLVRIVHENVEVLDKKGKGKITKQTINCSDSKFGILLYYLQCKNKEKGTGIDPFFRPKLCM